MCIQNLVAVALAAFVFCCGIERSAYCHLSDEVTEAIEAQQAEFHKVFRTLNDAQRDLTIQRYVDLVMTSPLNENLDIKRTELLAFVMKVVKSAKSPPGDVQELAQKTPIFSAQAKQDLETLKDKLKATFVDGQINLVLPCKKSFYEIPFQLEEDENFHALKLTLKGIPIPEGDSVVSPDKRCLEFSVKTMSRTADLEWLGTKNAACPIPGGKGGGTCLLDFAEQVMRTLELKSVTLLEVSRILCSKNRKEADLRRLKIFQEGQSWYEKNGYAPTDEIKNYKDKLNAFRDYDLEVFSKEVNPRKFPKENKILVRMLKKFKKTKLDRTLAAFMGWLWDKDCAAYIAIDALLADDSSGLKAEGLYPFVGSFSKTLEPLK